MWFFFFEWWNLENDNSSYLDEIESVISSIVSGNIEETSDEQIVDVQFFFTKG